MQVKNLHAFLLVFSAVAAESCERVFVPSSDFKVIEKDECIPKGIHVRVNLETGQKEGKILLENHENSLVLVKDEFWNTLDSSEFHAKLLLESLAEEAGDMDEGESIIKNGTCAHLLHHNSIAVRTLAARVVALAVANNPRAQKAANHQLFNTLFDVISYQVADEIFHLNKAVIFAIGALLRGNSLAPTAFILGKGFQVLLPFLRDGKNTVLVDKIHDLIGDLLVECHDSESVLVKKKMKEVGLCGFGLCEELR